MLEPYELLLVHSVTRLSFYSELLLAFHLFTNHVLVLSWTVKVCIQWFVDSSKATTIGYRQFLHLMWAMLFSPDFIFNSYIDNNLVIVSTAVTLSDKILCVSGC